MIGRTPFWIPILVGVIAVAWIVPLVGLVMTSLRPAG